MILLSCFIQQEYCDIQVLKGMLNFHHATCMTLPLPNVNILRLHVSKETDNNREILCDIRQWNADLVTKFNKIYANKQVIMITL